MTLSVSIRLICSVLSDAVINGKGEALEGAEVATESEQPEAAVAQVDAILEEERHEEESAAILEEAQLSAEPEAIGDGEATSDTCTTSTTERKTTSATVSINWQSVK